MSLASLYKTIGRPLCRPLFLALAISAPLLAQQDPLAEGVRITRPAVPDPLLPLPESNPATQAVSPVGSGLLRFYGCVTCHDLAIPPFRGRWGPDLDTVGSKSSQEWLHRVLRDPREGRKDGRMPLVPMSDHTRRELVSWLSTLTSREQQWARQAPDPSYDGERLYERGDCASCHTRKGVGGDRGPSLDGVEDRVRTEWLAAYLMNPTRLIRNSRMPLFDWEEEEAVALAHYLAGPSSPASAPHRAPAEGIVGTAAQMGCFQCHKVSRYAAYLDLPEQDERERFLRHHSDHPRIPIHLTDAQVRSMSQTLSSDPVNTVSDSVFLARFWETPIQMQGPAPTAHDSLASSLSPSDCASCHVKQHEEWESSLHAAAMGPGVLGQFLDSAHMNAEFVEGCQSCHAPNEEQHASVRDTHGFVANYRFDSGLRSQGITCIACHVRDHARFGPPVSEVPPAQAWAGPGHGGGHEGTAFSSSAFCSSCHQFAESDRAMNGKLLQDTFSEWRDSPHAARGETCQSCHMPNRSHSWLGIHDSSTVADAIEVEVRGGLSDTGELRIRVVNEGAGHHLPTYVTPKLFVSVVQHDKRGRALRMTEQVRAIGREIVLTTEESREVYDTRIPAGGSWEWAYTSRQHPHAESVNVAIDVYPDHFYERFFEGYNTAGLSEEARAKIEDARRNAKRSSFRVYETSIPLSDK